MYKVLFTWTKHVNIVNVKLNMSKCLVLFVLILYVQSTIFQLCGTGLPGLNQY